MQSSSAAYYASGALAILVALLYFPTLLTPDALAQSVLLPLPVISEVASSAITGTVVATSTEQKLVTNNVVATVALATSSSQQAPISPRLLIPSISLNDPIVNVGLTTDNAMAVPSGKTNQVGWYDGGPKPGDVGSAVLDAHVFAAFSKLNQVKAGDSIYVQQDGQTLHFVVTAVKTFALSQITSQDLFAPTTDRDLNLITCAGKLTPDHSTYDHRLVVYSTLVR